MNRVANQGDIELVKPWNVEVVIQYIHELAIMCIFEFVVQGTVEVVVH